MSEAKHPLRIGVLGSGSGSNMQSIQDAIEVGALDARIVCVVTDVPDARILERASNHHIPAAFIDHAPFKTKLDGEAEEHVIEYLNRYGVELVVLAGYMRIVKPRLLRYFNGRVLNIHPSLLPAFPGIAAWQQALEYGVKVAGCTVHFVDAGMDTGPIIIQRSVPVRDDDTPETLHARIQVEEHIAYPEAIRWIVANRVRKMGRLVTILPPDIASPDYDDVNSLAKDTENERYEMLEQLGEGATGIVYRAHDRMLDMDVAIKILHPELIADESSISSMKQEACVAMQLSHTCVVRLYHFTRLGPNYALVMEYIQGKNFHKLLHESKRFTPHAVNEIVQVCAEALNYAHTHGILHKDLKPANLVLNNEGIIKVIDFGVSCLVDHQRDIGEIAGTPQYMSPEHLRGDVLGPQADIYSLAVIAYQFLTGKLPFSEDRDYSSFEPPERIVLDGVTPNIRVVLETALDNDPKARYATISDFGHAFAYAYKLDFPNDRRSQTMDSGMFS